MYIYIYIYVYILYIIHILYTYMLWATQPISNFNDPIQLIDESVPARCALLRLRAEGAARRSLRRNRRIELKRRIDSNCRIELNRRISAGASAPPRRSPGTH